MLTNAAVVERDDDLETNILPSPVRGWPDLLATLELGDSFVVSRFDEGKLKAAIWRYHRRSPARFRTRVITRETIRCERVS